MSCGGQAKPLAVLEFAREFRNLNCTAAFTHQSRQVRHLKRPKLAKSSTFCFFLVKQVCVDLTPFVELPSTPAPLLHQCRSECKVLSQLVFLYVDLSLVEIYLLSFKTYEEFLLNA